MTLTMFQINMQRQGAGPVLENLVMEDGDGLQLLFKSQYYPDKITAENLWADCQSAGIEGFLACYGENCLGLFRGPKNIVISTIEKMFVLGLFKNVHVFDERATQDDNIHSDGLFHFLSVVEQDTLMADIDKLETRSLGRLNSPHMSKKRLN
jgi:hypothetical protein